MNCHTRTLHPAERKYVFEAALGYTAQQTANRYGRSPHTVKATLLSARSALGALSIAHAVALCLTYGEFTADDIRKGSLS